MPPLPGPACTLQDHQCLIVLDLDLLALVFTPSCSTKKRARSFHRATAACLERGLPAECLTAINTIIPNQPVSSTLIHAKGVFSDPNTHTSKMSQTSSKETEGGKSQSIGVIERAVRLVAGQSRTLNASLEHRVGTRNPARRKDIVLVGGVCCVPDEQV